jgi:NhaP-type Na+/H+ or K+/H+ antiporter
LLYKYLSLRSSTNPPQPIQWGWEDNITQELSRIIVGVQVFAVGVELPKKYVSLHKKSLTILLLPNMALGWIISAAIIYLVLGTSLSTALIIAACLTPTDPVLSASVLGEAKFSSRVPKRLRNLLSAESGCNDGSSFPFLYAGLFAVTKPTTAEGIKSWLLDVLLWQCLAGTLVGILIGYLGNRALRFSESRGYIQEATLFVFYFLLAILCVGVGSTLGADDFLVAFSAGATFCWDGWFSTKTRKMKLPSILDLLLNSSMFVYFGAVIPWHQFSGNGSLDPWKLTACLVLILLLRRIPSILALKPLIPDIRTWNEALFVGHFGPMGVGAIFLAIEARARLETHTSHPLPHPPKNGSPNQDAIDTVWPVICFVVLGSIMVHGCSAAVMSVVGSLARRPKDRDPLLGGERERLYGMQEDDEEGEGEEEGVDDEEGEDST